MNRPQPDACRHTYARIHAYYALRMSTRIGQQLRKVAGAKGDITSLTPAALQTQFSGADLDEALRLLALAQHIKLKYSHTKKQTIFD
jgi:hypothetical protein